MTIRTLRQKILGLQRGTSPEFRILQILNKNNMYWPIGTDQDVLGMMEEALDGGTGKLNIKIVENWKCADGAGRMTLNPVFSCVGCKKVENLNYVSEEYYRDNLNRYKCGECRN